MILQYFLWGLLIYFIYWFVFNFLVPVIRASRQIKRQVRDFQNRMQEQNGPEQQNTFATSKPSSAQRTSAGKGDYIDFEEVK